MTNRQLPKGIYLRGNKYVAQARINKKQIQLGTFSSLEEAVKALDKAIGRALQGMDTIVKTEKLIRKPREDRIEVTQHPDDDVIVEHFHLYTIVRGSTPYAQWLRNTNLPPELTLGVAKKFLAKREIRVVTLDDFHAMHQEKLKLFLEPWLVNYDLIGKGFRKNTLQVKCKKCKTLHLIRVGDHVADCGCGTSTTVLFFGKNPDGSLSVSISPTRPVNVVGCLYVPNQGFATLPALGDLEASLEAPPELEEEVVHKPGLDSREVLLGVVEEEEKAGENELDAYNKLLEDSLIDLDADFDFEVTADTKSVAERLLEEDRAEKSLGSASDLIQKDNK